MVLGKLISSLRTSPSWNEPGERLISATGEPPERIHHLRALDLDRASLSSQAGIVIMEYQ
jgi:hypothetical protein